MTVPCFLDQPGCPPGLALRPRPGRPPAAHPGQHLRGALHLQHPALGDARTQPARPSLYGHGLFGDAGEVGADNVEQLGNENDVLVCAADWIGMADEDVPNALARPAGPVALPDASPTGSSRASSTSCSSGRTMIHPEGFASNPAFQRTGGPLIDTRRLFYYGNSQGGIAGGALTAVAPDFDRSVLYVGAMNYSLLLNAQRGLRPVTRSSSTRPTRTRSSARCCCR